MELATLVAMGTLGSGRGAPGYSLGLETPLFTWWSLRGCGHIPGTGMWILATSQRAEQDQLRTPRAQEEK